MTGLFANRATDPASSAVYAKAVLDLLGSADPMAVLRDSPRALRELIAPLSNERLTRPEAPGKWSIRDVLAHLADSERVWAYRLRMVLAVDRPLLAGYDQDQWAARLGYSQVMAGDALEEFEAARRGNLRLLERTPPEAFARVGLHAERGEESVAMLIRLYAGHDLVHRRQIARIRDGQ